MYFFVTFCLVISYILICLQDSLSERRSNPFQIDTGEVRHIEKSGIHMRNYLIVFPSGKNYSFLHKELVVNSLSYLALFYFLGKLLQEKLSHHLDQVEVSIAHQVAAKSHHFFQVGIIFLELKFLSY